MVLLVFLRLPQAFVVSYSYLPTLFPPISEMIVARLVDVLVVNRGQLTQRDMDSFVDAFMITGRWSQDITIYLFTYLVSLQFALLSIHCFYFSN